MPRIPDYDLIDYLVHRKFPHARNIEIARNRPDIHTIESRRLFEALPKSSQEDEGERLWAEIQDYRIELEGLPKENIKELYVDESAREEQERFFNQPDTTADFAYWSKAAYWTLEEAIALSFGKTPETINWNSVKGYYNPPSPFAKQYEKLRDLVLRAQKSKQLDDPVSPSTFIDWVKRYEISFPTELENQITALGRVTTDWQTLYNSIAKEYEVLSAEHTELIKRSNELEIQLSALQKKKVNAKDRTNTAERNSMLKIIYGIAKSRYKYDSSAAKSEATSMIKTNLDTIGLPMDEATILKYLREGAELHKH